MTDLIIASSDPVGPRQVPPRPEIWTAICFTASGNWITMSFFSREAAERYAARDSEVKFLAYIPGEGKPSSPKGGA